MMVFISLARISLAEGPNRFSHNSSHPTLLNVVLFAELWIHLSFSSAPRGARLSLSRAELRWRQMQVSWHFFKFCSAVRIAMDSSAALRESSSVSVSKVDSVRVFYLSQMVLSLHNFLPYWTSFLLGEIRGTILLSVLLLKIVSCCLNFSPLAFGFVHCTKNLTECENFQSVLVSFR